MSGTLEGIRVIDFGQYVAGPQVAMMLGDQGADVIRVDPPDGPLWRDPANAVLQRGKRSIVLNLKRPDEQAIARRLIESADVVIENFRPGVMDRFGLGPVTMTEADSRLIYCSIPGFASDDPRAGLPAYEGVVGSATGMYWPHRRRIPVADAPVAPEPAYTAVRFASSFGAMVAANSIVAALIARERTGRGQRIEAPLFHAMFEAIGSSGFRRAAPPPLRRHAATVCQPQGSDGRWLWLEQGMSRHTVWLGERVLPKEWTEDGLTDPERLLNEPELALEFARRLDELCKTKPAAYWDRQFNEAGAAAAICQSTEEWLRTDEQARANGAVIALTDPEYGETLQAGYPVLLSKTPPQAQGPRHALDGDRAAILAELDSDPAGRAASGSSGRGEHISRALEGIRVLDLTQILAGPTAGRVLAEFGADVIKINSPHAERVMHLHLNGGKRTILLNLKAPDGQEILRRLVAQSRVFMQNFALGVADRIGIGGAAIRGLRPDIVYSSVSAYGYTGPRGGYRGWEPIGDAATGILGRQGGDGKPLMPPFAVCDYGTGLLSAFAILLGLYHQTRTGEGQHVQTSLTHAGTYHQLPFMLAYEGRVWDEPSGPQAKGRGPRYRLYQASDRWFFLAAPSSKGLQRLATVEGLSGLDKIDGSELVAALTGVFADAPAATWVERLQAAGIGAHLLMPVDEIMEDEWVKGQKLSVELNHPEVGMVRLIGPGARLSMTPIQPNPPAPPPGWHSREVVEEAGMGDRFAELVSAGVVAERLHADTPVY